MITALEDRFRMLSDFSNKELTELSWIAQETRRGDWIRAIEKENDRRCTND